MNTYNRPNSKQNYAAYRKRCRRNRFFDQLTFITVMCSIVLILFLFVFTFVKGIICIASHDHSTKEVVVTHIIPEAVVTETVTVDVNMVLDPAEPAQTLNAPTVEKPVEKQEEPEKEFIGEFTITYYCSCQKCCGVWATKRPVVNGKEIVYTASGAIAEVGITVAVDPSKIPYGTKLYIEGVGYRVAQDCGGAIKENRIDVYMADHEAALEAGKHLANVYIVNDN